MLKKRILASSLASVMALSSVSVVAFADETAEFDATAQDSVTKDELQKYVDSFATFMKEDIYDYGTVQSEWFQDAIDYAENVLADNEATADDYTAAFQMVKSVRADMEKKTAAQLQALLDDTKADYDSGNILNDVLGDHKWDQDKYDAFVDAYDVADTYVGSRDGRLITDAWFELDTAWRNLTPLKSVTKQQFRDILKQYETILKEFNKYENWRRGAFTVNPEITKTGVKLTKKSAAASTFGALKDVIYNDLWGAIAIDDYYVTVEDYIKHFYEVFDNIKTSSKTTDEEIVAAYNAACDAVAIWNGWKADNTEKAVQADVTKIIDEYKARMIFDFKPGFIDNLVLTVGDYTDKKGNTVDYLVVDKENRTIKATADFKLVLDKDTDLMHINGAGNYDDDDTAAGTYVKKIGKGQDIVKYIPIYSSDLDDPIARQEDYDEAVAYINAILKEADGIIALRKAIAEVPEIVPSATIVTDDPNNVTVGATQASDGTTYVYLNTAFTLKAYKTDGAPSAADTAAVKAYNNALKKVKTAYDKLTTPTTGLIAKAGNATIGGTNRYETPTTVAKNYAKTLAAYKIAVADIANMKTVTVPTNVPDLDDGTNTKTAATDVKDINDKVLVAATTSYAYKKSDSDATATASETDSGVARYNNAIALWDAACTLLPGTSNAAGEVADVLAKETAYNTAITTPYTWIYNVDLLENLQYALETSEAYLAVDDKEDYKDAYAAYLANPLPHNAAITLDENNAVGDKPVGSRTEWCLVYRFLKYSIEDIYAPENKAAVYTKRDVEDLIEKCYELAELTGEASIFADVHMALVEGRRAANEWVGKVNADKTYKEGNPVAEYIAKYTLGEDIVATQAVTTADATYVYIELKKLYDALWNMLQEYPVSYGEVADLIATVGTALDDGVYGQNLDEIKNLLKTTSKSLSTLEACDDENQPFTDDREFNQYNRVHTGDHATTAESTLYKNYKSLKDLIAVSEGFDVVPGDLNDDGTADLDDALKAVEIFLDENYVPTYKELAAGDLDENGVIDLDDALAIIDLYMPD